MDKCEENVETNIHIAHSTFCQLPIGFSRFTRLDLSARLMDGGGTQNASRRGRSPRSIAHVTPNLSNTNVHALSRVFPFKVLPIVLENKFKASLP